MSEWIKGGRSEWVGRGRKECTGLGFKQCLLSRNFYLLVGVVPVKGGATKEEEKKGWRRFFEVTFGRLYFVEAIRSGNLPDLSLELMYATINMAMLII